MSFNKLLFKLHFYCILDISEAVLFKIYLKEEVVSVL